MEDTNKLVMDSSRCTSNRTDFKIKGGFNSNNSTVKVRMVKILVMLAAIQLNNTLKVNSKHNHHRKRTVRLPALHQYRSGKLQQRLMGNNTTITKDQEKQLGRNPLECPK